MKYITVKVPKNKKEFQKWATGFTANVLRLITAIWGICMVFAGAVIAIALFWTGEFSYLDTFINRVCDCFVAGVVTALVTRVIGNVFQYNDGGIFGISREEEDERDSDGNN